MIKTITGNARIEGYNNIKAGDVVTTDNGKITVTEILNKSVWLDAVYWELKGIPVNDQPTQKELRG